MRSLIDKRPQQVEEGMRSLIDKLRGAGQGEELTLSGADATALVAALEREHGSLHAGSCVAQTFRVLDGSTADLEGFAVLWGDELDNVGVFPSSAAAHRYARQLQAEQRARVGSFSPCRVVAVGGCVVYRADEVSLVTDRSE